MVANCPVGILHKLQETRWLSNGGKEFPRKPVAAPQSPKQVEWPAYNPGSHLNPPEDCYGKGDNVNNVIGMMKSSHDDQWRILGGSSARRKSTFMKSVTPRDGPWL